MPDLCFYWQHPFKTMVEIAGFYTEEEKICAEKNKMLFDRTLDQYFLVFKIFYDTWNQC